MPQLFFAAKGKYRDTLYRHDAVLHYGFSGCPGLPGDPGPGLTLPAGKISFSFPILKARGLIIPDNVFIQFFHL